MSESAKTIIKYFCDRFLDIDYYPSSLKDILNLELKKIKNIKKEDLQKFQKYGIITFRDLCNIEQSDYKKLTNDSFKEKTILNNTIIASTLIANAWNKRNIYLKKPKMKVVVVGLDFAGKTSLINRLIHDYNYNDMINIEPTFGCNIEEYQSKWLNLILWDLGGQKDNINEYLESPEKFFVQLDVLIFVIDSQDDIRYNEAIQYLKDLIEIFKFLNENPYIVVLLNKVDSDIIDDPDFHIKLEYLMDKISNLFKSIQKSWNYEIIQTSIYNFYSTEPEIAKSIKKIFSKGKNARKLDRLEDIENNIEKLLDLNQKLMDIVISELSEIKRVLFRFTPYDISDSLFPIPFKHALIEEEEDKRSEQRKEKKKRKIKIDKSKRKNKFDNIIGPPKRLKNIPPPTRVVQKINNNQKITEEKLKNIKNELIPISQSSNLLSKPPIAPKKEYININSLKPPPPPPRIIFNDENSLQINRRHIVSELKELFIKKGLVPHKDL